MNNEDEKQIAIQENTLSIIQKDLENKIYEYLLKRFEIDQKYIELKQIRTDIYKLKSQKEEFVGKLDDIGLPDKSDQDVRKHFDQNFSLDGEEKFEFDKGLVFLKKYKTEFSSYLKKEFNKLDIKKKRELFKVGLLKIRFYLNYVKYEKVKNEGKKTALDDYVFERSSNFPYYLNIKFNEKTNNKLENIIKEEADHSEEEKRSRESEINFLEEEINDLYDLDEQIYGSEEDWDFSIDYEETAKEDEN
jgi:hypothetical protein